MVNRIKILSALIAALLLSSILLEGEVPTPVLKWKNGGYKFNGQYNKAYYCSPATLDVNGDGVLDVIWANYWVMALDGQTGSPIWACYAGTDMSNPTDNSRYAGTHASVAVADINNDGQQEIVTAQSNGWLGAYNKNGYYLPGFPLRPTGRTDRIQSITLFDLDNNGDMEIIIGWAKANNLNTCVIEHNGAIRSGWPQYVPNENANALGIFNANIAVGDLTGDGYGEIISPSDTNKTCAYYRDGSPIPANAIFSIGEHWCQVPCYISYADELAGWNPSPDADIFMNTDQPAVIADVNEDGTNEVVIVVQGYSRYAVYPPEDPVSHESKYLMPMIFNIDRTRFNQGGYNWESAPPTGGPLSNDVDEIVIKTSNPVVVDLDGDNEKEILTASYDGKLHAFWLDKTQHHSWPYSVYSAGEGVIRFPSEPAVADLDGDGSPEVIFATWPEYDSYKWGHLYILNYRGELQHKIALPYGNSNYTPPVPDVSRANFDGGVSAPTIADVDDDGQPEILVGTVFAGLVVYDLPGAVFGAAPWPTGRHDYCRTAWDSYGSFTLAYPNGGETLDVGFLKNIAWNSVGISGNVKIEYSTDNGSNWNPIASSTPNDGSYTWEIPDVASGQCLVRVGNTNGTVTDTSDAVFTIQPNPSLFDDAGHSIIQTSDGGYLVAGTTDSYGAGGTDMILYRLNASGQKLWRQTYGGGNDDFGWCVAPTSDGGCVLAGSSESFTNGGLDFLVFKLEADGNEEWRKNFGGSGEDRAFAVQQTSDGGYIVAGYGNSFTVGGYDLLLFKLDADGNKEWRKNLGGTGDDYGYAVQQTSDGGYIVAGSTDSFTNGGSDFLLFKLDASGNKQWRKNFGGSLEDATFGYQAVQQTSDNGYALGGYTDSFTNGGTDFLGYKLKPFGGVRVWKNFGGTGDDLCYGIRQTSDGGYLVAGYSDSYTLGGTDFLLFKLNAFGKRQWRKNFGGAGDDVLYAVTQTSDGGYAAVGETLSFVSSPGYSDILIYKLNSSGNKQWRQNF